MNIKVCTVGISLLRVGKWNVLFPIMPIERKLFSQMLSVKINIIRLFANHNEDTVNMYKVLKY